MIACGVWSPLLAKMAGAHIPLTPAVHQMIDVGPVPRFEALVERDRVPDRARHGRVHVRAPGRRRPRDRLLRPPLDPPRPGGDPVDRGGGALADGVPVHAGGLRRSDGARARADAGDRRRRVRRREVRDQRAHLADARRDADPRRDARGEGPLVGGGGVGEGGARRRQVARRVDGATASRTSTSTPPTRAASTTTRRRARTSRRARSRRSRRPTGSCTRPSSGRASAGIRRSPMHEQEQALGAVFYEAVGWERPQWYEANAPLVERYGVEPRERRVGCPLVVADHQRRASRDARARRHLRPLRLRDLRRLRAPARSTRCSTR